MINNIEQAIRESANTNTIVRVSDVQRLTRRLPSPQPPKNTTMSKTYEITTDSGTTITQATNVRDALAKAGIPADSAEAFAYWLEEVGGYGTITEDGVVIARVAA